MENINANTKMSSAQLRLRSINDLLQERFIIPSYQRGYRWTNVQVESLLQDIWDFNKKKTDKDDFYCLQPIVVTKKLTDDYYQWELIDGQQRLTTIFILLTYLNSRFTLQFRKSIFTLEYKTRKNSVQYLNNINDEEKDKNIDYHFIFEALETIKKWFQDKQNIINDFESTLLNNAHIIWYEVEDESADPIDIFTRINIGKIPLTNAELIKALFLQKSNFAEQAILKQLQIATEWDQIEKKLQDNSFWYFIYNPTNSPFYENRIEYIFDLKKLKNKDDEDYYTFNKFQAEFEQDKLKNGELNIDDHWLEVKRYFLSLEEWFNDRELFHLIGFLIENNETIVSIKDLSSSSTKLEFKDKIKQLIQLKFEKVQLDDLRYQQDHRKVIKMVLLLFNIQTILSTQKAELRFPFDKYKIERWDIEHVNSQTEKTIKNEDRKSWALDLLEYFTGQKGYSDALLGDSNKSTKDIQLEAIETLDEASKAYANRLIHILEQIKVEDEFFMSIYNDLKTEFKESYLESNDNISNLALLDESTNRSYGNAMFPIKRKRIIENDMKGIFVPIGTKNLFLKYYSKQMGEVMFWNESDAKDYLLALNSVLIGYLPPQNSNL